MKYLILFLLASSSCFAESYTPYSKVSISYILDHPKNITFNKETIIVDLYTGDKIAYAIESGIMVNNYRFGVSWSDLLNQSGQKDIHRPYKLEIFGDHYWRFKYVDFKVGTGFKIAEDRTLDFKEDNGDTYSFDQYEGFTDLAGRITARFSITKQINNVEFGIAHHSQWFQGKPFNNKYEYGKTEIVISYVF